MTEQQQVNTEDVLVILRVRLSEEIYQRAMIEAAYTQTTQQVKTLTEQLTRAEQELARIREQAATQHTQLSQQLEHPPATQEPENQPHQFTPTVNPPRYRKCNYTKDTAPHTPVNPQKVKPKN